MRSHDDVEIHQALRKITNIQKTVNGHGENRSIELIAAP